MATKIAPIPPISGRAGLSTDDLTKAVNQTIIAMNQRLNDLATPASGTGQVDDAATELRAIGGLYNDLPIGRGSYLSITMRENRTLTGIAGGVDERAFVLQVQGSGTLTLQHQSTASAEGNRLWIHDGTNSALNAAINGAALFIYSQKLRSWMLIIGLTS